MTKLLLLAALLGLGTSAAPGAVSISEFLAQNDGGWRDQDGDTPDWIELFNNSPSAVNLAGWHLTDSPADLAKWTFPSTALAPGAFLVVFASGKDRAVSGAELHTSFQLNQAGGYLALVDGKGRVVCEFNYPNQRVNVSFGTGFSNGPVIPLLTSNASTRWLLPSNGTLGLAWTTPGFEASTWNQATAPLSYNLVTNGAAGPPVLRLDFNDRDSNTVALTAPGFETFLIGNAGGNGAIQTGAVTRTFGTRFVTLSNSAPGVGYDDRARATPLNSGALTTDTLYKDFVFSRELSGTSGLDLYVGGLTAETLYELTLWSFDSGSPGARVSDWWANGVLFTNNYSFNGSTLPTSDNDDRLVFRATADGSGGLLVSGRRDTSSAANAPAVFVNALQVAPVVSSNGITGNLAAMAGGNASVYLRHSFTLSDPGAQNQLTLRVSYNDGFVAYLNGTEVARRNAPALLDWQSAAIAAHAAKTVEDILLPSAETLLVAGPNLLAVQGLNVRADDGDFYLDVQLLGTFSTPSADRYLTPPTPGQPNGPGYDGLVADTKFSVDRGFHDTPFSLSITSATAGAAIYFTTNGSAPSPSNGVRFTTPLSITGQSFIRAAAFVAGQVPSDSDTHSYLFLRDVLRQSNNLPNYPTTWQANYPADYAMDSNLVRHPVYGASLSNDLRGLPSLCLVSDHTGLWNSSTGIYPNPTSVGPAWERAASVELIRGDGQTEFATTCQMQIHGNASRDNARTPKHAFGLNFNSAYGPAKLRYDWFGGGVDTHDKMVLRNCGFVDGWAGRYADEGSYTSTETGETFRGLRYRPENTCYLRDAWVKDSFRAMGWTASRSQYVHLYLNGLYWGLYEPSEHLDASYFSRHHGGPEGAWDVLVGEDNNGPPVIVDGSGTDWTNVLNLVNAGLTNAAAYQTLQQLVDLDNLIDYMLLHIFAESEDWPRHNWYVAHRRATNGLPATRFVCTVWDQELTLDRLVRRNRTEVGNTGGEVYGPARVYAQLRAWPEFRVRFGDRVQKHLFQDGALTPSNNVARLLAPAARIRSALVAESARWGDARKTPTPGSTNGTGQTFTRDEWWQPEIDQLTTNFFQKLTADNVARLRAANLYPALAAPELSQFGGAVPAGFALTITHPNATGTMFLTLDGSDPRVAESGAVAPAAQAFDQPVPLNAPTLVRARVLDGTNWSALVEATFYPPQDLSRLAVTEIMYNPPPVGTTHSEEFEFLELKNTGTNRLDLSGLTFTDGITFTFTNGTLLAPGAFFVLVRNPEVFASLHPGVAIGGLFSGQLNNGGEKITLAHPFAGVVFSVSYDDVAPWPVTPDNHGFSLVPRSGGATPAPDDGAQWRASSRPGGSPGAEDPESGIAPVVINEILSASVPPQLDTIELFNPTATNVDLSGWFLTDDPGVPRKFRLPDGTVVPGLGWVVFDERQFNATPGTNGSFALGAEGDEVYLFSGGADLALTGYSHGFGFGAAAAGVSFGRYVNSAGEEQFPAQLALTFGNANSGPWVGPVVLNELHYHPAAGDDSFVELKNITAAPVPLFDETVPTNTWRLNGIGFDFPTGVTVPPGGLVLLVATNPSDFRMKYAVPTHVPVLGPYSGALQRSGERLQLERPTPPTSNGVFHIVVDAVRYNDKAPWPAAADGSGPSLQRITAAAYGDDPSNWLAAAPTPGREGHVLDTDGDGLPDAWEIAHGTNPTVPDALADPDQDGLTNWQEYLAGTLPLDPASQLRIESVRMLGHGQLTLGFTAVSNRSYTLQSRASLQVGAWSNWITFPPEAANRFITVTNRPAEDETHFYRVATPAQ